METPPDHVSAADYRSASITDACIAGREALLDIVLNTRADTVLNPHVPHQFLSQSADVAADLMRAMNEIRAAAIDPAGRRVAYADLRTNEAYRTYHNAISPRLRTFDLTTLHTRAERRAFWINLYNALIIDAVIAFKVQDSVTEGRLGMFTFFRRAAYNVGGSRFSCNDIEHGILRGNRGFPYLPGVHFAPSDPRRQFVIKPFDTRIHFALNCASRSCPPINVYDADHLDDQLELATRNFITRDVEIQPTRNELHLSSIFKWYRGDFDGREGTFDLVHHYLPESDERAMWISKHRDDMTIVYKPYDWTLNGRTSRPGNGAANADAYEG